MHWKLWQTLFVDLIPRSPSRSIWLMFQQKDWRLHISANIKSKLFAQQGLYIKSTLVLCFYIDLSTTTTPSNALSKISNCLPMWTIKLKTLRLSYNSEKFKQDYSVTCTHFTDLCDFYVNWKDCSTPGKQ